MKRDGLITAERSTKDKRTVNIYLTDKGRQVLEKTKPVANEIKDLMMSSITEDEAIQMASKLKVLRKNAFDTLGGLTYTVRKWPE